jgi:hypothetical protein
MAVPKTAALPLGDTPIKKETNSTLISQFLAIHSSFSSFP